MTSKLIRPGVTAAAAAGSAVLTQAAEAKVDAPVAELDPATGGPEQGLVDEPRTWWFTFPAGHPFAGRYAATHGLHDAARAEVIAHFGETFIGQFATSEEAGVLRAGLLRLRRDQWPAVDGSTDAPTQVVQAAPADGDSAGLAACEAGGEQPTGPAGDDEQAAVEPGGDEPTHGQAGGWAGSGPGEAGVRCFCGLVFDGFGSIAEAGKHLDDHIAEANTAACDEGPESGVPAAELRPGMFVATGDPEQPGLEVRHVEPAEDGVDLVGVVFTGPRYAEYDRGDLLELVDKMVVDQAAARARRRAHRARQIEGLCRLAALAQQDESFPLPTFTLQVGGGLDNVEAVRRFAAALEVPVTENEYGARAEWECSSNAYGAPAVQVEFTAPHAKNGGVR
ncbi:hypothetical protein AB0C02_30555 [Micromonospora sp. NPDC048999]|uniref:hypothetical protein n=1 Tax=Micromonospora sp. NPDC048999 TaxID=3155391 RepID=UPI0033C7FA04